MFGFTLRDRSDRLRYVPQNLRYNSNFCQGTENAMGLGSMCWAPEWASVDPLGKARLRGY